jgi:hypothetical protein
VGRCRSCDETQESEIRRRPRHMRQRKEEEGREWGRVQGWRTYGITVLLSHFTLLRYNRRRCASWLVFYLMGRCFSCCLLHTGSAVVYLCRPGRQTVKYILCRCTRFQPVSRGIDSCGRKTRGASRLCRDCVVTRFRDITRTFNHDLPFRDTRYDATHLRRAKRLCMPKWSPANQ